MGLFQEYLNSKGKIDKPVIDPTADRVDPMKAPTAPPKEGNLFGAKSDGKSISHYANKGSKADSSKGFGDQGDSKLKYTPEIGNAGHAHSSKVSKLPVAEQAELCSLISDAIKKDTTVVGQLVSQLKNEGMLGVLVAEMLQHKATYENMVEVMGHKVYGKAVCSKLMRAMSEEVAPQFSDSIAGGHPQDDVVDDNLDGDDDEFGDDDDMDDAGAGGDENSVEGIQAKIAELKQKLADMGVDPDAPPAPPAGDPNVQPPQAGPSVGPMGGGAPAPAPAPAMPMMRAMMAKYMNRW